MLQSSVTYSNPVLQPQVSLKDAIFSYPRMHGLLVLEASIFPHLSMDDLLFSAD